MSGSSQLHSFRGISLVIGLKLFTDIGKIQEKLKPASLSENLPALTHSKVFHGNFKKQRTKAILKLSRNRLCILTDFRTGHCHLSKQGKKHDCRFCHSRTPDTSNNRLGIFDEDSHFVITWFNQLVPLLTWSFFLDIDFKAVSKIVLQFLNKI